MNIKQLMPLANAAVAVLLVSCSPKTDVIITVTATSAEQTVLYLSQQNFKGTKIIDSVRLSEGKNVKKFRLHQDIEPTFYTVGIRNKGAITLLASQSEQIALSFSTNNLLSYKVEGSEGSKRVQTLSIEFAKSKQRIDELRAELAKTTIKTIRSSIENEIEEVYATQKDFNSKFIWENPMSKASVMAIYQKFDNNMYLFDSSDDLHLIKTVASAMNALYPESDYAKGMLDDVKNIERIITSAKIRQMVAESEQSIPDLEIEDRNGKLIKLSSLKGKVVLLDFWHSQNTECLMENRELLGIYSQFKPKGFEVYQIAMDDSRTKWIEAVDKNKLPWISVFENSNQSYASAVYNVQQVPANYLIDRNLNIVGKNLFGNELRKKLSNLLGN